MIRVTEAETADRTTVTIDGCLSAEYVNVVETCCKEALSRGLAVDLFLRDVSAVDESGRNLLRRMDARGVHLLANGVYTSYLVHELMAARPVPLRRLPS